jgi:uncharacterized protein (TIGR02246 family)
MPRLVEMATTGVWFSAFSIFMHLNSNKMNDDYAKNNGEQIRMLYQSLLENWNKNNASGFARLFTSDGTAIGFDGSEMNGQEQIEQELSRIFSEHQVARYVSIIREVRQLSSSVYLLRAVAGMIPPGKMEINPKVNAIQTLIAQKEADKFKISIFQNTPAAFHGRPVLSSQLTSELQETFNNQQKKAE